MRPSLDVDQSGIPFASLTLSNSELRHKVSSEQRASTSAGAARKRGRPRHEQPSQEYETKRREVVSVASEVFRMQGYDAGTLDDVAAAMNLRKASLYYYVKSKADLLRLIFDRAIDRSLEQIEEYSAIEDPRTRLEALIRHQARTVANDPALFAVFFDHRAGLKGDDAADIATKERRYLRHFIVAVEDAMDANVLPKADPRMVAATLIGMSSWVYKWMDPVRDDPVAFADLCVQLILRPRD